MSGFQEIAAIVGIAEVSFRSISALYEFVSGLKHIPKELERLQTEIFTLTQSLTALEILQTADKDTKRVLKRVGLPAAIANCGDACRILQDDLSRWTHSSPQSFKLKVHFRMRKKNLDSLLSQISFAKQTTILCVVVAQLSVQLQIPISDSRRASKIALVEEELERTLEEDMSRNRQQSSRAEPSPQDLARMEFARLKGTGLKRAQALNMSQSPQGGELVVRESGQTHNAEQPASPKDANRVGNTDSTITAKFGKITGSGQSKLVLASYNESTKSNIKTSEMKFSGNSKGKVLSHNEHSSIDAEFEDVDEQDDAELEVLSNNKQKPTGQG